MTMNSYSARFEMMGTFIDLVVYHPNGEQLIKDAYIQLKDYATRFTVNQADSELMRVNQNAGIAPIVVAPDLFELIKLGQHYSEDMSTPFNIAIGPLVKTWRIGFQEATVPPPEVIDEKLALVDPTQIMLNEQEHSVFLRQTGMEIDLGAIAKGYFADQVKQRLIDAGVASGFISLGGNVLTIGHSPKNANRAWNVGIQNPLSKRGDVIRIVPLQGMSMVTSGINERFFELNGQRYHHLLDGKTGMPISTDIASLTIVSERSVDGEIWSTAGFLPSALQSIRYLNTIEGIEAVVVSIQGEVMTTDGFVGHKHPTDSVT
ncbi:FAD:protein FMN transferase [Vibrio gazogenes]|uniref:FAD:protein FMN transferase n=1 Tax=Vibrio gazogenes DSM 21264 = NBRC 103151 TaxID=1123492 RepID=A0A1M5H1W1_VIBGA|nr:FAD:protein FMN transferase [Vibrio gazogenes]USP14932.1 FAD:protein FMN transferase [Vibrio gazogenes]SHG09905.1 thiamine biosynthesis lipoprotein [Vibrio gazogenes DSM 21264] [Vibrio gazogenes DSM 21264 = NBRC 103151]SJN53530.1 Thiamine biosynthesis lipoprotein ApbE precursor [Vibrio gazogenes]